MIPYHTPAELRRFSNIGHVVEGILLGAVALVVFAQAFGYFRARRARYILPGILVVAGLFLPAMILVHPTLEIMWAHARVTLADLQQKQHLAMAALLLGSGIAEAYAIRYRQPWLRTVWPVALMVIGILFLIHPQHGAGEAVRVAGMIHRWLGFLCIASGAAFLLEIRLAKQRWTRIVGSVLLLLVAVLLAVYREPPGALEHSDVHAAPRDEFMVHGY